MSLTYTGKDWLTSPLGQYLLRQECVLYDQTVADLFGFHAVQLGLPEVDLLQQCRIPFRFRAALQGSVTVQCLPEQLPFANQSLDLVVLPHVIEYTAAPHEILREVERILVPEGHLVLSGFNPVSLWGVRRLLARGAEGPWAGSFLHISRLKDWLALLGMEVVAGRMCGYVPPINRETWLKRCRFMDSAGDRWWPMLGGVYFLVARKRVMGMRLIGPSRKRARIHLTFAPNPAQHVRPIDLRRDRLS